MVMVVARRENAGKRNHAFDVPPKRTRARACRGEYADGGRVVSRGLVGRLQPRFSAQPSASSAASGLLDPSLSLSLFLFLSVYRVCSVLLCVSLFLHAPKATLKRYRKIITGKALHTRVRQTAGPTSGITLILVSFGPTD